MMSLVRLWKIIKIRLNEKFKRTLNLEDTRGARIDNSFASLTAKRFLIDGKYGYVTLKRQLRYHCEARVVTGLSATVYERAKYPRVTIREFQARAWNVILVLLLSYVCNII